MLGSFAQLHGLPSPIRLGLRALLASLLVILLVHASERPLVEAIVPVFGSAIGWLSPEFSVTSAEVVREGANESVRFRANLSRPIDYAGRTLYPFGWKGLIPTGGFQVTRILGSVFEYDALLLIVILAWPARRMREMIVRLALSLPLLVLLALLDVPFSVVADLWNLLRAQLDPNSLCGWVVWSRFLMGGGGLVLACLLAATPIAAAQRITCRPFDSRSPAAARDTGYARLVIPRRSGLS